MVPAAAANAVAGPQHAFHPTLVLKHSLHSMIGLQLWARSGGRSTQQGNKGDPPCCAHSYSSLSEESPSAFHQPESWWGPAAVEVEVGEAAPGGEEPLCRLFPHSMHSSEWSKRRPYTRMGRGRAPHSRPGRRSVCQAGVALHMPFKASGRSAGRPPRWRAAVRRATAAAEPAASRSGSCHVHVNILAPCLLHTSCRSPACSLLAARPDLACPR